MSDAFPAHTPPEMCRTELSWVILQLKSLGIDDVLHFSFITPPPPEALMRSLELLYALGAIDDDARLTEGVGQQLADFPCHPRLSKVRVRERERERERNGQFNVNYFHIRCSS
jgi:ATP-dependent RNA helicase DDX35